jgi:hypothetical protein
MIDEQHLREGLQRLLRDTETAIRERISDEPSIEAHLRERHDAAVKAGRTAGSASGYNSFADDAITQSGVHWLLGCVFVRFLEDNGWLDERNKVVAWLSGPGEKLAIAKSERTRFLRPDPTLTDRDYLLYVFREVAKLPGMAGLFGSRHNPLFQLGPTAQGAAKIAEFFQKIDPDTGGLVHDFTDPKHETRFLGDLYQNLSESARKRYALLQTPGFVVDFILDRTLTPAIDTFGLDQVHLIDPACGSGHFLLASFARLFRLWQQREPATNPAALAQKALDAVHGVDLNPFAAEISRFRLLIAALEASGVTRLRDALNFAIPVAAGDSLLHGTRRSGGGIERGLFEDRLQFFYETEDEKEVKRILDQTYHVVVGNPPYINVSDPALREAYRVRFSTCHGKYQLGVPFTERFFDLALRSSDPKTGPAGWMGMIVSNAFMKRTFGKKLIEGYLVHKDLTHVIDTSGVYLPGHGTPTTIMLGRNQSPVAATIRAVRGIRGETGIPADPGNAPVWREIVEHVDQPGFEGGRISVADAPRDGFARHPWPIGGGGAAELKELLEELSEARFSSVIREVGFFGILGADEVMQAPPFAFITRRIEPEQYRPLIVGESIRDWQQLAVGCSFFAYDLDTGITPLLPRASKWFWPFRTTLGKRPTFAQKTYFEEGRPWWGWHQLSIQRAKPPLSIVYGEIATHNHFLLDRGGEVFNQTAPVIKLPNGAKEDQHLELLGLLNSSTACFWLKQVCFPKGGDHVGTEGARVTKVQWEERYAFDSTKLKQLPLPEQKPLELTRLIQAEADGRSALSPEKICHAAVPTRAALDKARNAAAIHLALMISLQEELDWKCYRIYGIIEEDLTAPIDRVPPLELGQRAFEIRMARQIEQGTLDTTWFERHRSSPVTEIPAHWPEAYRQICVRRLEVASSNRDIALIEQPEYKRRWNIPTWEDMEQSALKNWLLDRIEANAIWQEAALLSCSQLRDALARDADWVSVAAIYSGGPVEDFDALVVELAVSESVPFLPVLRYTDEGLRKRCEWEQVWDLQRKEDEGETAQIPVPPKYRSNDFLKSGYWRLRGGLDVPKERFILYSRLERDSDRSPVLGWAGWNYLEQAKALAGFCQRMRTEEGWEPERLKPVLAGLLDLKPWLLQWHNELDPETGVKLGEYFVQFAENQCQELDFSPEEVRAWQPAATTSSRARTRRANVRRPQ